MKKYYCLKLNNCFATGAHYVSNGVKCTMLPGIIVKDVSDLSNINEEFMELHDSITVNDNSYTVSCSFPVIGELRDGVMYDLVTGRVIECYDVNMDNNVLSYREKVPAYTLMAEVMLSLLDSESIKKYSDSLEKIANTRDRVNNGSNDMFFAILTNSPENANKIIVEKTESGFVEPFTKELIYPAKENTITNHLTFDAIKQVDKKTAKQYRKLVINSAIDDYYGTLISAKRNTVCQYNDFANGVGKPLILKKTDK